MEKFIYDEIDNIDFKGKVFCLTSDLVFKTYNFIEELITQNGGICEWYSENTDFVIVGNKNDLKWDQYLDSFIIEEAQEAKLKGDPVKIISKDTIIKYLQAKIVTTDPSSFEYKVEDDGITIINYIGSKQYIKIPELIGDKPVLRIGDSAFEGDKQWESKIRMIILPKTIISIGARAFCGIDIELIELPKNLKSIGSKAFSQCSLLEVLTIPESVVTIGENAFEECDSLALFTFNYKSETTPNRIQIRMFGKNIMTSYLEEEMNQFNQPDRVEEVIVYIPKDKQQENNIDDFLINSGELEPTIAFDFSKYDAKIGRMRSGFYKPLMAYKRIIQPTELGEKSRDNYVKYLVDNSLRMFMETKNISVLVLLADNNGFNVKNIDKCIQIASDKDFIEGTAFLMDYKNKYISREEIAQESAKAIEKELNKNPFSVVEMRKTWDFTYKKEDDTYVIEGYRGPEDQIKIPGNIRKKNVTLVDGFNSHDQLTTVTIPESVRTIAKSSFHGCAKLKKVVLPKNLGCIEMGVRSLGLVRKREVYAATFGMCPKLENFEQQPGQDDSFQPTYLVADGIIFNLQGDRLIRYPVGRKGKYVIPEHVTSIGDWAFSQADRLTSIVIHEGVISIGSGAFSFCERLKTVAIPKSVTSIASQAFWYCKKLESIELPDSLTSIKDEAFSSCYNLTSVVIPESVKSIGEGIFSNCNKLTSVVMPESLTSISKKMFWGCSSLIEIDIPAQVTSVEIAAFSGCRQLLSLDNFKNITHIARSAFTSCKSLSIVEIPEGVTAIGDHAFNGSDNIISISIPESVTHIGTPLFHHDSKVTISGKVGSYAIEYAINNRIPYDYCEEPNYISVDGVVFNKAGDTLIQCPRVRKGDYIIPDSVTTIADQAFRGCYDITSLDIPNSVINIGELAFESCHKMTSIKMPDGITSIPERAFNACKNLTSIIIPDGVITIGDRAFDGCKNLPSVLIPNSVTSIHVRAFPEYQNVQIEGEIGSYGIYYAIKNKMNYKYCAESSYSGDEILLNKAGDTILRYPMDREGAYTVPDNIIRIGKYAFSNCNYLTSVKVENSVTSIGDGAFANCGNMIFVELPDGMTSIEEALFEDCKSLASIEIPDSVITISDAVFCGCSGLTTVKIPGGVTSIGDRIFNECSSLTQVKIPDGVTRIGDKAFNKCKSLKTIKIPDGVTSIGDRAFNGCSSLTSIEIPDSVRSIGESAFESCTSLMWMKISKSVTSIDEWTFVNCSNLTAINIPDSVISIGKGAFSRCVRLTSIEIPDSVTSIGDWAFEYSDGLTVLEIPDSVTRIGKEVFPKKNGFEIRAKSGSVAIEYARENKIKYIEI